MPQPTLTALDHLVLTVRNLPDTCRFYQDVLGMHAIEFQPQTGPARWALTFGTSKINLHEAGKEFEPKAHRPTPGSADLCFLTETQIDAWLTHLAAHGVPVEAGPVARTGAKAPLTSLYIRDPDQNLIEIAVEG